MLLHVPRITMLIADQSLWAGQKGGLDNHPNRHTPTRGKGRRGSQSEAKEEKGKEEQINGQGLDLGCLIN